MTCTSRCHSVPVQNSSYTIPANHTVLWDCCQKAFSLNAHTSRIGLQSAHVCRIFRTRGLGVRSLLVRTCCVPLQYCLIGATAWWSCSRIGHARQNYVVSPMSKNVASKPLVQLLPTGSMLGGKVVESIQHDMLRMESQSQEHVRLCSLAYSMRGCRQID